MINDNKNLSKEFLKLKIRCEVESSDFWSYDNFIDLNEAEWNALLDNLYQHFQKLDVLELYASRVSNVLYHSLKSNFYTSFPDVTIKEILNNLSFLDPEVFDYEELQKMRNQILEDIEAKKVISFALARKRK